MIPLKNLKLTNRFIFDEVSKELVDFLHYLEDTTSERVAKTDSERIKRIHDRVCKVRLNEEEVEAILDIIREINEAKEEN